MRSIFLSALLVAAAAGAQPSTLEQQIVAHVDKENDRALALLEQVVNINSGTMNFDGVREVGHVFAQEFTEIGFEVSWVDGAPFSRAGHLVAEWRGGEGADGRPHLLLIGHLDTVFEPDSPFQKYEVEGTEALGPGTTDMKGGDVVMIHALRALHATGALDDLAITVVMTGDEEKSGRPLSLAREVLVEAAERADVAIGFEDGDSNPETAVIARRGSSGWLLEVSGVRAHSSQIFTEEIGAGAIYEAARILTGFYEELANEKDLTFSPGAILGGTEVEFDREQARGEAFGKGNVVAQKAVVSGDLRALSLEQLARSRETMRAVVERHLPRTEAKLTFADGYPPLAPTDGNRRLLAIYDEVSRDLGFGAVRAVDPRKAGAADVSFTAGLVEMALDGIGLMGRGGHTPDEVADLTTLPSQTKRAAVLLHRVGEALRTDGR